MHEDNKTASHHNTRITMTISKLLLKDVDEILKEDIITRTQFITMAIKEKLEKEKARKEIMLIRN